MVIISGHNVNNSNYINLLILINKSKSLPHYVASFLFRHYVDKTSNEKKLKQNKNKKNFVSKVIIITKLIAKVI